MRSINFIRPAIIAALILSIPAVAMLIQADGWDWNPFDFLIMGALLFGAGLLFELLANKAKTGTHKTLIGIVIFIAVLAIWSEMAVGAVSQAFTLLTGIAT